MTVIAIDSDLGSDGDLIAATVATRLELNLIDDAFLFERLKHHGLAIPETFAANPNESFPWCTVGTKLRLELLLLAQQEQILLHWPCAPYLLAEIGHIPRIKVRAPLSVRVRRYAARWGCNEQEARRRIAEHEGKTRFIFNACFGVSSPRPADTYHLVADTGWLAPADWADEIVELAKDQEFAASTASQGMLRWLLLQLPQAQDTTHPAECSATREC